MELKKLWSIIMKNKAHFYGSSFTWGHGLWLFDFDGYHKEIFNRPDFDWNNILLPRLDIWESDIKNFDFRGRESRHLIDWESRKFCRENRVSKLLSNHYGLEEVNRAKSGGLIAETVIMMNKEKNWESVGLLSIEFYGIGRYKPVTKPGMSALTPTEIEDYIENSEDDYWPKILKNWVINFDYDFELKTQLQKLEEQLEKIEKFNIPTVIHFWESYDIREIKNIILDYPLVDKYTMNKDESILEWAKNKYQIHDEHPYYNKSIGKRDQHLGVKGHKELFKRIKNFLGEI